jgi:hypothetical protein
MNQSLDINSYFQLAVDYVNTTNEPIYLTGKAGTGKTTFLKYIKDNCFKKLVIAAPTGVAAMNAGGVTLHSLFQLPIGSFYPDAQLPGDGYGDFFDKKNLLQNLRLNRAKRDMIQELELLIIDEVSMLRADMLDAIDVVLRSVRRKQMLAFGGVQVLFIGDLFQLPPVIKNHEWQVLKAFYQSPSFFSAIALKGKPPIYLELKNIYRQSDEGFIKILNNIRNNQVTGTDLEVLNGYYKPNFKPEKPGEYITLTTHNNKANSINSVQLKILPAKEYSFQAKTTGDFNENTVTAETDLKLKEGAQIMFIRNDKGEKPRYFNGKIGLVKRIKGADIAIQFADSNKEIIVEKDTWENKRYKLDKASGILEEDVKGTFTQYPIRLAWAITIHKSQGLTFDKAIIDAGESFAAGQVYVALSRLTSLDGLVLYSKITDNSISSDQSAIAFSNQEKNAETLNINLIDAQTVFIRDLILKSFDWQQLKWEVTSFLQEMHDKKLPEKDTAISMMQQIQIANNNLAVTSGKFNSQLFNLLQESKINGYSQVHERVKAAVDYFNDLLYKQVFLPLNEHYEAIKIKSGVKKYSRELKELVSIIKQKKVKLEEMKILSEGLSKGKALPELLSEMTQRLKVVQQKTEKEVKESKKKKEKGESHRLTLQLYKDGKTIAEISHDRSLAPSTVEGHLMSFIGSEFELTDFVSEEKIKQINTVIDSLKEVSSGVVKAKLGNEFSYAQIRAVMNERSL